MRVFLSWSGEHSGKVASALREWIPSVIQAVEPWISTYDIEKGQAWFSEIQTSLAQSKGMGIFCLTHENLLAPWLAFEAGALASHDRARVATFLFNVGPEDVKAPLALFQATKGQDKSDVLKLLTVINAQLEKPLEAARLAKAFEANWPSIEDAFKKINDGLGDRAPVRPRVDDLLQEILNTVRRLEKDQGRASQLAEALRKQVGQTTNLGFSGGLLGNGLFETTSPTTRLGMFGGTQDPSVAIRASLEEAAAYRERGLGNVAKAIGDAQSKPGAEPPGMRNNFRRGP